MWEKWFAFRADPPYLSLYGRYDPGMIVRRHGHRSPHVVFVLEGSIWCGDRLCPAGTHIELPEGAAFGPFRAGPEGVTMFEVMLGDPRSWGDQPERVDALRAEHGVEELPDPEIDLPSWLEDERARWPAHLTTGDRMRRVTSDVENPAIPAATVVLVRDGAAGLEVLMLHRVSKVAFGGMWVFPGGKVDDADRRADEDDDEQAWARRAAAREALEECGLAVDACRPGPVLALGAAGHHAPPLRHVVLPRPGQRRRRRSSTAGRSTSTSGWRAREVLDRRDRGEVDLAPPTWVTLHDLAAARRRRHARWRHAATRDPVPHYETRWAEVDGGAVAMWDGDSGYDAADPDRGRRPPPPLDARGRLAPRARLTPRVRRPPPAPASGRSACGRCSSPAGSSAGRRVGTTGRRRSRSRR